MALHACGSQVMQKMCCKGLFTDKVKANQSGLATYAGNAMTHMPCSHSAAISLGHQEILDDCNCNHV